MNSGLMFGKAARRAMAAAAVFVMAFGVCAIFVSAAWAAEKKAAKEAAAAATTTQVKGDPSKNYTETAGDVKMEMIWIPAGTFQMGSRMSPEDVVKKYGGGAGDEEYFQKEHPVHEVELDGFWMGKFEVTNAQFRKFRPSHASGEWEGRDLNGDNQPAVRVTWNNAKAFCEWLSEKTGKTYTLPTEAQWEYACRAGTETERYWGDDDETMGRYASVRDHTGREATKKSLEGMRIRWQEWFVANTTDGYVVSAPVGSFAPNKLGLCDMIGNVFEWCGDWYGEKYYGESPRRNPTGPSDGIHRVVRGGSWDRNPRSCRSAARSSWRSPGGRTDDVGFRVVRTQK